jgi:hypothetical protein
MIVFAPRIERYTQGGPIEFYTSLRGTDCYIEPLFKTYADLFYSRKPPPSNPREYDRDWLLSGSIDNPVYFVSKSTRRNYWLEKYGLQEIKTEYGFSYFVRMPEINAGTR